MVHELGHALGLKHVPVAGNIMSYDYMPRMSDLWRTPIALFLLSLSATQVAFAGEIDYSRNPLVQYKEDVFSRMYFSDDSEELKLIPLFTQMFTQTVTLGEQDKMALMCVYDFEDWNH